MKLDRTIELAIASASARVENERAAYGANEIAALVIVDDGKHHVHVHRPDELSRALLAQMQSDARVAAAYLLAPTVIGQTKVVVYRNGSFECASFADSYRSVN